MKKILLAIVLFFILINVFNFLKKETNELGLVDQKKDFLTTTNAHDEIKKIIKTSCYDCHSYETVYPTYSKIFPVSLLINRHIDEGREYANFSTWTDYNKESKQHILEEAIEEIEEGKMPMSSYTLIHAESTLTKEQKQILINWLKMQLEKI